MRESAFFALIFFFGGIIVRETAYQSRLAKRIETELLPGSMVVWPDPRRRQGIPDLLILYKNHHAVLEVKMNANAEYQPNQEYYINVLGEHSFASFIYPENEDEVLNALQEAFGVTRQTCLLKS